MEFVVNAVNPRREIVSLRLQAASAALAGEQARASGLSVLSVRPLGFSLSMPSLGTRVRFPVTLFSIELMALLEAGLNLVEALQTLAEKEPETARREVLGGILAGIRRGEPISRAIAAYPQHFSALYVATLKASERTGNVREALGRYVAYQEEIERVKKKIVSASIYPVILLGVGALVMAFLVFYVVPRFARVYDGLSTNLPFFSSLLLNVGKAIESHGALIGFSGVSLIFLLGFLLSNEKTRTKIATLLWRIPSVGERLRVYQLARLYRTAGMLLRAGIPALQALRMVSELLSAHLRPQLARALALVGEGKPMSAALGAAGLATPVATRMMLVGERSGDMGTMLGRIAAFHDDETARHVEWFTRAFEPLLMAALGLAVGLVVVLMYMPIFELAGSIR
ncbi:MAG TPA: type II secretion system F family protein [Burkholderiales bacterium]|jgi:general secretion pathway protein F|nr:type II secretion system F family protein [Burkholderiales bacterium]